jgi:hypothetical protein
MGVLPVDKRMSRPVRRYAGRGRVLPLISDERRMGVKQDSFWFGKKLTFW